MSKHLHLPALFAWDKRKRLFHHSKSSAFRFVKKKFEELYFQSTAPDCVDRVFKIYRTTALDQKLVKKTFKLVDETLRRRNLFEAGLLWPHRKILGKKKSVCWLNNFIRFWASRSSVLNSKYQLDFWYQHLITIIFCSIYGPRKAFKLFNVPESWLKGKNAMFTTTLLIIIIIIITSWKMWKEK